jgi:hypothetical protein
MASFFNLKLITSAKYHLWNDALHARKLARETMDKWNKGTYVRWTVTTSCTVLEICCQEVLEEPKIGYHFKDDMNKAILNKGLISIDWGSGKWQKVIALREVRRKYIHVNLPQNELWPDLEVADNAIEVVREAVIDIFQIANMATPKWIYDDNSEGWK